MKKSLPILFFCCLLNYLNSSAQTTQTVPFVNGGVTKILRYNNNLFISGSFTVIGSDSSYNGIAMLNAHTAQLQSWNPQPNHLVYDMTIQSGKLIVVGSFTTMAGQPRNGIAIFDAATGMLDSLAPATNMTYVGTVYADSNTIYFAGFGNGLSGINRFDLNTGAISSWTSDQIFYPMTYNTLAKCGNYIYLGGSFSYVASGTSTYNINNLIRFDVNTGLADTSFMSGAFSSSGGSGVYQILPYRGHIYVAGNFSNVGNNPADGFIAMDSTGVLTSFDISADNSENWSLFPQGDYLWVGGNSYSFGGQSTFYAAQISLNTGLATCWVKPDQNLDLVGSIFVQSDTVYIGGFYSNGLYPVGGDFEMAVGNVVTSPSVSVSASSLTPCQSVADTFTATAVNAGISPNYQWYSNNMAVGSNSNQYITSNLSSQDTIRVVVANTSVCGNPTGISNNIIVHVTSRRDTMWAATICQGSAYNFQGRVLTQSGFYSDTSSGCGSIVSLSLTVLHNDTNFNYTMCYGNHYNFNGAVLTDPGIYRDTLISSSGCDSIITLTLGVDSLGANLSLYQTGTICAGTDTLHLTGSSLATEIQWYRNDTVISSYRNGYLSGITVAGGYTNSYSYALPYTLYAPADVWVDGGGYIYVADQGNNRIQQFPPNSTAGTNGNTVAGSYSGIQSNAANGLDNPTGVALDNYGDVLVADNSNSRVQLFFSGSGSGSNATTVASGNVSSYPFNNQLSNPASTGIDGSGNLYVYDQNYNDIEVFPPSSNSTTSGTIFGAASGNSYISFYGGLWVNPNGNVYSVASDVNYGSTLTICELQPSYFNNLSTPVIRSNDISIITGYTSFATSIQGICADANDNIYVSDAHTCAVIEFPAGSNINSTGIIVAGGNGCGSEANQLRSPAGLYVDGSGNIYVADQGNNRIQKFARANSDSLYTPNNMGNYVVQISDGVCIAASDTVNIAPIRKAIYDTICSGSVITYNNITISQSGIYIDTVIVSAGCDSIVTLFISTYSTSPHQVNDTICAGSHLMWNGLTFSQQGSYSDTLSSVHGCDSIVILNLIVLPNYLADLYDTICDGSSYLWRNGAYTQNGLYSDTLNTTRGCDSIIKLHLFVRQIVTHTFNDSICQGDHIQVGQHVYTSTGHYYDTLVTTQGCDSIIHTNLTILPLSRVNIYDTICAGNSYQWQNGSYTQAGIYMDTLTAMQGCDSILNLYLYVRSSLILTVNDSICQGSYLQVGQHSYSSTGSYIDTFSSALGCDSIINTNLTVLSNSNPSLSLISIDGSVVSGMRTDTFTAIYTDCANATFDWYENETSLGIHTSTAVISHSANSPDTISCIVNCSNECASTVYAISSDIYTGIRNPMLSSLTVRLYPNPTSGILNLQINEFNAADSQAEISILDLLGQAVIHQSIDLRSGENSYVLGFGENTVNGIYIVQIAIGKSIMYYKVTLQRP